MLRLIELPSGLQQSATSTMRGLIDLIDEQPKVSETHQEHRRYKELVKTLASIRDFLSLTNELLAADAAKCRQIFQEYNAIHGNDNIAIFP